MGVEDRQALSSKVTMTIFSSALMVTGFLIRYQYRTRGSKM